MGFTLLCMVALTLICAPFHAARADMPASANHAVSIPEQIDLQSKRLMAAMRQGDLRSARSRVQYLVSLRVKAHIANLTPVAAAFLSRFRHLVAGESSDDAQVLAAMAVDLAPDYPAIYFNLADAYLDRGIRMIGPATGAFFQGLAAYSRYPRGLVTAIGNISFYAVFSIIMMVLMVSVILVFRHGRTLAHDISDLFPSAPAAAFSAPEVARSRSVRFIIQSGLTRTLAFFITFLVLVLPLAAGLGLLVVVLIWTMFIGVYVRRSELAAVIFVHLGIILILPLGILTYMPLAMEQSQGPKLWACLREYCWSDQVEGLNRLLVSQPDDPWVNTALALHRVQGGLNDPRSLTLASHQLMGAQLDPKGSIATLRGNIQVLQALALCPHGKPDKGALVTARESFKSALRSVPDSPQALRGLSIADGILRDTKALEKHIQRLVDVSPEQDLSFVARIRTLTSSDKVCKNLGGISAMLRTPPPPDFATYFRGFDPLESPQAIPFRTLMLGRLPIRWLPVLTLISLLLFLAVLLVRKRYSFAYVCPRCGGVSCDRCNVDASGFDYCPTCLLEQVRPAFLDPLDLVALQRKQDRKRHWVRLLLPLVSLLVPGSGQVMSGRPVRGLMMIGCLSFALGLVLNPTPYLVDYVAYSGSPGPDLPALPPLLLGMVYFWSAIDIWLTRRR
ncbi:MAG: hypothetical protein GXP54_07010 [Deltaproteobacteria bacterium]|nr:hypothetical protein [Deltaproteobacteria bacterium]